MSKTHDTNTNLYQATETGFILEGREFTLTSGRTERTTGLWIGGGLNNQDGALEVVFCTRCGHHIVWATSNRSGKKYRVNVRISERGNRYYVKSDFHQCSDEAIEIHRQFKAVHEAFARKINEVTVGCEVVIVKGRKFPIGTEGVAIWIASEADGYGVVKVCVKLDNGERIYVNEANLSRKDHAEA